LNEVSLRKKQYLKDVKEKAAEQSAKVQVCRQTKCPIACSISDATGCRNLAKMMTVVGRRKRGYLLQAAEKATTPLEHLHKKIAPRFFSLGPVRPHFLAALIAWAF